jgi:hypothetical protein
LFLVKIVPFIAVIVSSPNVLLAVRGKRRAVIVAVTATVVVIVVVVGAGGEIAMTAMNGANAGKFGSSSNKIAWEMSLVRDGISLCLYSVAPM